MSLSMADMADVADTLARDFRERLPARTVTRIVLDVATHHPHDDRDTIEADARARLAEVARGNAPAQ